MEVFSQIVAFLASLNWAEILVAVQGLIAAIIAVCLIIPGEQPEKFLQSILDFLSKLSKK